MSLYNNCLEISFWGGQSTRPIMRILLIGIWDRFTDLVMASPLLGLDSKLIPDPIFGKLESVRQSEIGSGIRKLIFIK